MKQMAALYIAIFLMALSSSGSLAQPYPNKPIRLVIGYPPGTILDSTIGPVLPELRKRLGQSVVMDFRPGANGLIAAKHVVGATPDGYTLLYATTATIHPVLMKSNAVDAAKELASISQLVTVPFHVVARSDLQVGSIAELVNRAKASSPAINHGFASPTVELCIELLRSRLGFVSSAIPYKSSPQMLIALMAGEIDFTAGTISALMPQIQAGKIRPLFVASTKRTVALPAVPTATEVGIPNFELSSNLGLWAPLGTPKDIIQKLSMEASAAVKLPEIADRIRMSFVAEVVGSAPEEQLRSFEREMQLWAEAARVGNYQPQ